MERLTIPDEIIDKRTTRMTVVDVAAVREYAMEFYWRLKACEDTGLSPAACKKASEIEEELAVNGYSISRMVELIRADKEGCVVILPCEPGAPVYITFCGEVFEMRVGQFHVNGYTKQIRVDIDHDGASTQYVRWDLAIGKTVFLTRKEAEAKLEEVQNA